MKRTPKDDEKQSLYSQSCSSFFKHENLDTKIREFDGKYPPLIGKKLKTSTSKVSQHFLDVDIKDSQQNSPSGSKSYFQSKDNYFSPLREMNRSDARDLSCYETLKDLFFRSNIVPAEKIDEYRIVINEALEFMRLFQVTKCLKICKIKDIKFAIDLIEQNHLDLFIKFWISPVKSLPFATYLLKTWLCSELNFRYYNKLIFKLKNFASLIGRVYSLEADEQIFKKAQLLSEEISELVEGLREGQISKELLKKMEEEDEIEAKQQDENSKKSKSVYRLVEETIIIRRFIKYKSSQFDERMIKKQIRIDFIKKYVIAECFYENFIENEKDAAKFLNLNLMERCSHSKKAQAKWKNIPGPVMLIIKRECQNYFSPTCNTKLQCISKTLDRYPESIKTEFKKFIYKYDSTYNTFCQIREFVRSQGNSQMTSILTKIIFGLLLSKGNDHDDLGQWLSKSKMLQANKEKIMKDPIELAAKLIGHILCPSEPTKSKKNPITTTDCSNLQEYQLFIYEECSLFKDTNSIFLAEFQHLILSRGFEFSEKQLKTFSIWI